MSKKTKITVASNYEDWMGLYINGELVVEGHEVTIKDLCYALGHDYESIEFDSKWLQNEMGLGLPKELTEVKLKNNKK